MSTSLPSERAAVVGIIAPLNGNNATTLTGAVDMSLFHEVLFILKCGVIDQTVDFKITECATSGGSYTDISGKSITQFAATDDGKVAVINVKSSQLGSGKRYLKGSVTVGNGTSSLIDVTVIGLQPRFGPANDNDLAAVAQIV